MNSCATPRFWRLYRRLPRQIRLRARIAYHRWRENPNHPGLHFKPVDDVQHIYSVRVGAGYRVLGTLENDTMLWFWIGNHDDYVKLLKSR